MPLAQLVVVEVVSGRDLHCTGPEVPFNRRVRHDRQASAKEGQDRLAADQLTVAFVVRVHGHRRVAQDGFRPRGGDADPAVRVR
jgi:hypothetical protein